jgi:hypothetical protein
MLTWVAEPLVTSTNHGRATKVIAVPVLETISATRRARSDRFWSSTVAR